MYGRIKAAGVLPLFCCGDAVRHAFYGADMPSLPQAAAEIFPLFEVSDGGREHLYIIVPGDVAVQSCAYAFAVSHFAEYSAVR